MKHQTKKIIGPAGRMNLHSIVKHLSLATLALAVSSGAAQYAFVNVAGTTDTAPPDGTPFTSFGTPSFSGATAAFIGNYDGFPTQGIFTGNGGALATIADTTTPGAPDGTLFNAFGAPSMSGNETAFWGLYRSFANQGVFLSDAGALTTIVKLGNPAPVGTFGFLLPDVAVSGGTVAFSGWYGNFNYAGIFTGSGAALTKVAATGDTVPLVGMFYDLSTPSISGDTAAFVGYYGGGEGVFTGNGGSLTTIAKTGDAAPVGTFNTFVATNPPSISGDTVAFVGYYGSSHSVFTGNGGALTTIAKTGDAAPSGTFNRFVGPSISGNTVAFTGFYSSGHGIFTSAGGTLTTVIKTGDALFDSTVTSLFLNRFGLDEAGSGALAFRYSLADGRSGVAVASPASTTCPCDGFSVSSFEPPMGKKKTLRSTLPIKFQLFFDGVEIGSQEQLDQILENNGCSPACPGLTIYECSAMGVTPVGGLDDDCIRPVDDKWMYHLKIDPNLFSHGKLYLVEVSIGDCTFVDQGNNLFEVK